MVCALHDLSLHGDHPAEMLRAPDKIINKRAPDKIINKRAPDKIIKRSDICTSNFVQLL